MSQYAATMGATMQMIPIAGFMGYYFLTVAIRWRPAARIRATVAR